jgi:hypothetical protein
MRLSYQLYYWGALILYKSSFYCTKDIEFINLLLSNVPAQSVGIPHANASIAPRPLEMTRSKIEKNSKKIHRTIRDITRENNRLRKALTNIPEQRAITRHGDLPTEWGKIFQQRKHYRKS